MLLNGCITISVKEVLDTFKRMAFIVDKQNNNEKNYIPMSSNFKNSIAFNKAQSLVFNGSEQPSGYTELILHSQRLKFKKNQH